MLFLFGPLTSIPAMVVAIIARRRADGDERTTRLATAGLTTGAAATVFWSAFAIMWVALVIYLNRYCSLNGCQGDG